MLLSCPSVFRMHQIVDVVAAKVLSASLIWFFFLDF